MRQIRACTRLVLTAILALGAVHCGDTKRNKTNTVPTDAGADNTAGEGGESGTGGSGAATAGAGGSTSGNGGQSGADPGSGGTSGEGGAGGEAASTGNGGTAGSAGSAGAAGSGGLAGNAGTGGTSNSGGTGGGCVPAPACGIEHPPCDAGWDDDCGIDFVECCDPVNGIYKTCDYSGGGTETVESVLINSCTMHSFGTEPCNGCLNPADPDCDADWLSEGCSPQVFCSDYMIGYRASCLAPDQFSFVIQVECVCDPG